jgi:hypothetical protein
LRPQAFDGRPELEEQDEDLLRAYRVISRERPQSMGGIPGITLASIERYLRFWPEHDPVLFADTMIAIDEAWRGPENEKLRSKRSH